MVSNLSRGAAFAVGCIAFVGPFVALTEGATLTATLTGYAAGGYEQCGFDSGLSWNSTSSMTLWSVRAQQHVLTEANGNQNLTWCAEVYQGVDLGGTYTFNINAAEDTPSGVVAPGPMGMAKAGAVRDLFARWINPSTGFVSGGMADRDAKTSAFQVVLWELTHENFTATTAAGVVSQMSLSSGAFRASLSAAAAGWYSSIVQSLGQGGFQSASIEGLTNDLAQDQIRMTVPAPAAIGLLGLAGLVSRRRR